MDSFSSSKLQHPKSPTPGLICLEKELMFLGLCNNQEYAVQCSDINIQCSDINDTSSNYWIIRYVYPPPEHTQIFTNNPWVIKSSKTSKTRKKRGIELIVLQAGAHIGSLISLKGEIVYNSGTAKNITRSMSLLPNRPRFQTVKAINRFLGSNGDEPQNCL